jgi:hypothetical protein
MSASPAAPHTAASFEVFVMRSQFPLALEGKNAPNRQK